MQRLLDILSRSTFDISACLTNCSNKGQCFLNQTTGKYFCVCITNFIGKSCQTDSRPCSRNTCLNNGTCINVNNSSFQCECNSNFNGTFCENRINICEHVTCSSNGYCFIKDNVAQCKCFINYKGDACATQDEFIKIKRAVTTTSLIVFLVCISIFVLTIISNDFCNLMIKRGNKINHKSNMPSTSLKAIRFKYHP